MIASTAPTPPISTDTPPGQRPSRAMHLPLRGWHYHLTCWGDVSQITPERPALVLCHGWMDVGASFQFLVDALNALEGPTRFIVAPDWRGYGRTQGPACDNYWFPDYLGDLEALLQHPELGLAPQAPIDLLGHSMGGNVAMMYAGIRPQRIRRLINLEGFGMPASRPEQAPARLAQWLDALATPQYLKSYASLAEVAERLCHNNPLLSRARADWLAPHWATQREDGRWHLLSDPAHKRIGAQLYRVEEVLACWRHITAPVLWMEGDLTDTRLWWGDRYPRSEFEQRLGHVPNLRRQRLSPCGHMLHHDQPDTVAAHLLDFLQAPADQLASRG